MAQVFYTALIVCVAAMYMVYAAPNPQQGNPIAPPAGLPATPPPELGAGAGALTPPPGTPEAPANNYTGAQPHNCTEFVQKCSGLQGNQQLNGGANTIANGLGPIGSSYAQVSKYDCSSAAISCNGTAPPTIAPPTIAPPAVPGAPSPGPAGRVSLFNLL